MHAFPHNYSNNEQPNFKNLCINCFVKLTTHCDKNWSAHVQHMSVQHVYCI